MDYFFEKGKFNEDELEHAIIELFAKQEGLTAHANSIAVRFE